MYQLTAAGSLANWTCSIAVLGATGSGTLDLCSYDGGPGWSCSPCNFNSSTWSICENVRVGTAVGVDRYCKVGNNSNQNGGIARAASDVWLFGMQGEELDFRTSYVPTTSSAATRASEEPYFSKSFAITSAGFCVAATVEVTSTRAFQSGAGMYAPSLSQSSSVASSPYFWPFTATAGGSLAIDSLGVLSVGAVGYYPATDNATLSSRYVAGHNGTAWFYCVDGVCRTSGSGSTVANTTFPFIRLYATAGVRSSALWSNIQVDSDWTRCTR